MKEHSTRVLLILAALAMCSAAAPSDLRAQRQPGRDVDDPVLPGGRRAARAIEEYNYTPGRPSGNDKDGDGITDDLEQRLLDKFAPIFKYDHDETVHPLKVGDYLGQAFLIFRHDDCEDHAVLSIGELNLRSLVRQVHPLRCDHRGGSAASNAPPPRPSPWWAEFYYLGFSSCIRWSTECQRQAEDDCRGNPDPACLRRSLIECHREFMRRQREAIRRGETIDAGEQCEDVGISRGFKRADRIEAYAAVRPSKKAAGAYEIMVRVFYPQNTLQAHGFGYHAGDWEGVNIHVTRDERAFRITYHQHEGGETVARSPTDPNAGWRSLNPKDLSRRDPEFDGGTHLIVFVAAKSHASYRKSGSDGRGPLLPSDHHRGDDFIFHTQGRIVNVGRTERPSPGSEWIEFRGYWGQDWDPATLLVVNLEGASPPTPRF